MGGGDWHVLGNKLLNLRHSMPYHWSIVPLRKKSAHCKKRAVEWMNGWHFKASSLISTSLYLCLFGTKQTSFSHMNEANWILANSAFVRFLLTFRFYPTFLFHHRIHTKASLALMTYPPFSFYFFQGESSLLNNRPACLNETKKMGVWQVFPALVIWFVLGDVSPHGAVFISKRGGAVALVRSGTWKKAGRVGVWILAWFGKLLSSTRHFFHRKQDAPFIYRMILNLY